MHKLDWLVIGIAALIWMTWVFLFAGFVGLCFIVIGTAIICLAAGSLIIPKWFDKNE
jgi:hypothetical protein